MKTVGTLLFPGFELLDVFGPLEMFGALPDELPPRDGRGARRSRRQQPGTAERSPTWRSPRRSPTTFFSSPAGAARGAEVDNKVLIDWVRAHAESSTVVATVCTGAALLARTGLLDGRKATSNKAAFRWVMQQGPNVLWQPRARWVVDGKYFTSSGVSAGMDMALALIASLDGRGNSASRSPLTRSTAGAAILMTIRSRHSMILGPAARSD